LSDVLVQSFIESRGMGADNQMLLGPMRWLNNHDVEHEVRDRQRRQNDHGKACRNTRRGGLEEAVLALTYGPSLNFHVSSVRITNRVVSTNRVVAVGARAREQELGRNAGAPAETTCWTKPRVSPRMWIVRESSILGDRERAVGMKASGDSTVGGRANTAVRRYSLGAGGG